MSETPDLVGRIGAELARASALRDAAKSDPKKAAARQRFRAWQARRLARTHANLLANPRFAEAATFFLTDIYGANDPGRLYDDVRRVLPTVAKVLPAAGLETVTDAIELDALSEDLDAAMIDALGKRVDGLNATAYGKAYRAVNRRVDRERQINLILLLGQSLDRLAHKPFISTALAMMRKPAQIAGFGELQSFLERGYGAFHKMAGAEDFLNQIVTREKELLEALFAGDDRLLAA
jgi:hypothetical protein